jgi:hypothetical protein
MVMPLIALPVVAAVTVPANLALAQNAFPAPLPSQAAASSVSSAPTANLAEPAMSPSETQAACLKGYNPLREDAEKKGKLIKEASDRHASPVEACKIIASYRAAEVKMIKYLEVNAVACEVPARITEQLKNGHKNTEALEKKVCAVAEQTKRHEPAIPIGLEEVLDPEGHQPQGVISDFGDPAYGRIRRGF